jgi:hydroxymethylglutaryl-CoA synthase
MRKMKTMKVGIGDIRVYVPRMKMELNELIAKRVAEDANLEKHFNRAKAVTGQRAIRFPAPGEDSATMAAEAAYELMADNSGKALANLRYIAAGTETGVDHSKPLSSYVQGMLQRSGLPVPSSLATFQVQHACAGGTLGVLSVAGMLAASGRDETGLVLATDISRYTLRSTAEITQGAGAAAVLIEANPRLLELDVGSTGYCSRDVDDFFRPLGSVTAKVKGSYSMDCYNQSLEEAFQDHAARSGADPVSLLNDTDFVVLHTPFRNMPEMAMKKLLSSQLGLDEHQAIAWLEERGFYRGVDPIADIGNGYSASLYLFMAFLLKDRYAKLGQDIVGKKLLIASYGSGNIMTVTTAVVAAGAPAIIERWKLDEMMAAGLPASMADYERWAEGTGLGYGERVEASEAASRFRLIGIREDGFREYDHERDGIDQPEESKASVDLSRPVAQVG